MAHKIIIALMICSCNCFGQKLKPYTYNVVDTFVQYKDAETITYKNSFGKSVTDTIYLAKKKKPITIEIADVVIIESRKVKN